jgi:hypothetical protein
MFFIEKKPFFAIPITHYNMEMALAVNLAIDELKPDCIAVEFAETMQLQLLHAASRLPDTSVVIAENLAQKPIYYMCEPCDAGFEALRSALEKNIPAFCIDLDVSDYPQNHEPIPDSYAITRIGLKKYYEAYKNIALTTTLVKSPLDKRRELYMAKRLKELTFSFERILFIGGMAHVENVLKLTEQNAFPDLKHTSRNKITLAALTSKANMEVMAECGYITSHYEKCRQEHFNDLAEVDRQKLILQLFKEAAINYTQTTGNAFPGYYLRNLMKFLRNYALTYDRLMPDLYQIITAAKLNVDSNFAYEVWLLATSYEFRKNIDGLEELDLSIEDLWGKSKIVRFNLKQKSRKNSFQERLSKANSKYHFKPGMFSICSYPKEDLIIERFGNHLKKKGTELLREESAKSVKFNSSLEDGIDTRETIRHWHEKTLYVKVKTKPQGEVGSVVVIFDEDLPDETPVAPEFKEKYPWTTSWLGEHSQESDMAFYATRLGENVIGPGISRCEYGGFMMSYPPRRLRDIWSDPDYDECQTKAEKLLLAAIDYAVKPLIVYVAAKPPRSIIKSFARRFGKKIIYLPVGQFSPQTLNKLRIFHVLDGHDRRVKADDYIF